MSYNFYLVFYDLMEVGNVVLDYVLFFGEYVNMEVMLLNLVDNKVKVLVV